MTQHDLTVLDTLETSEFLKGELIEDDLTIPAHLVPPNPDDSDILPSKAHPSYPYGDPTNIKHPVSQSRPPYDPFSRALFEDLGYAGGGINWTLRWKDLAVDELFPVDEEKEEAKRAVDARKMASGTGASNAPGPQQGIGPDTGEEEENDENENVDAEEDDDSEDDDDDSEETEGED
ncbi:hypothetical protein B0H10DRAFT_2162681 [Mycena sp. CBHHK59/15]|nr:hypothetical protein B0H10DRAFT_2162681 [Mycena sp. CBHHK59/15]